MRIIFNIINNFYLKKILLNLNGYFFVIFFNLYNTLLQKNLLITYNIKEKYYIARSKNDHRRRYFFSEGYANYSYHKSLKGRGNELCKDYFLDKINFKNGDTVIDCGANVGDLYLWFEDQKLNIEYIGFEPSPREYWCLNKNIKNHKLINQGLWKENKNLKFYVSSESGDSSFIKPVKYSDIINIPAVKLSNIIDKKVKLLKLEAEGAEPEILYGAEDKLINIEYISADLGYERGEKRESTFEEVKDFLLQNNFALVMNEKTRK